MGFWKKQQEAIDELECFVEDIKDKASFNTFKEYVKEWDNLYYHVKDNLKELGVKK